MQNTPPLNGASSRKSKGARFLAMATGSWIRIAPLSPPSSAAVLDECSVFRPGDVVHCEPRRAGHGGGRRAREEHDVSMEVGLVGIAAFGGDLGGAQASGQMMSGVIEADQAGRALRRQA